MGIYSSVLLNYISNVHRSADLPLAAQSPDLWLIIMHYFKKQEQRVHTKFKVKTNPNSCFSYSKSAGNCAHYENEMEGCSPQWAENPKLWFCVS